MIHAFPQVLSGENTLLSLGKRVADYGWKQVLLVTDPGLLAAGHGAKAQALLSEAGIVVTLFSDVRENPTTHDVQRCLAAAQKTKIDAFVAVGGGSVIDTAKGANFLLTNGGKMEDYLGRKEGLSPLLPLVAVPTTAGTGSEMQSYALIARADTHTKMACGDDSAMARLVILDPALTLSLPHQVTAQAGLDALVHSVETLVTRTATPESRALSMEAFQLLQENLPRVLSTPHDLKAREAMLVGAAKAGEAIERSMLGAAHAAANPLTAHFDIPHGTAVSIMLPSVIRYNAQEEASRTLYEDMANKGGLDGAAGQPGFERIAQRVETLMDLAQIQRSPTHWGVTLDTIPTLAKEAAQQWTGTFNPRPVVAEDFEKLYRDCF